MKNNFKYLAVIFASTIITAQQKNTADKVFINGNIITVDAKNSTAQAVAVSNGKFLAVGSNSAIEKLKDKKTIVVDLKGKTVVPGFIDGHSHFMGLSRSTTVNVGSPPMGTVKNIAD